MKNKVLFLLFICLSILLLSCEKKSDEYNFESTINLDLTDSNTSNLITSPQKWHITNKRLCVIFGYDFNTEDKYSEIINLLSERYGLAEDNGLIYPLIFPNDFKSGGRSYHNNLRLILENDIENLIGVVILGAPEKTHVALARNQDFWDMKVPYPVIALFPQDDILGLEATCDIVLEKGQSANFNGEAMEENTSLAVPETPEILIQTIDYILALEEPFEKNQYLSNHVLYMLRNHQVHHYIDPETGLKSINHFILN